VFIPVAFLGGIAGQLYRQFAVTVTIAVVLSGVVALTLTPALCALLLKPGHGEPAWARPFNRGFGWVSAHYLRGVHLGLRHRAAALAAFAAVLLGVGWLLWKVPGSFVPPEDQGWFLAAAQLPDGATLARTEATTERLRGLVKDHEALDNIFIVNGFDLIGGGSKSSAATIFMTTKPWEQRRTSTQELTGMVSGLGFTQLSDGVAFAFNPPPIQGLGQAGGFEVYVQARADPDPQRLAQVTQAFMQALGRAARADAQHHLLPPQTCRSCASRSTARRRSALGVLARRGVRRAAGADGLAVRQRLQQGRPHLPRDDAGRRALPRPARGPGPGARALGDRRGDGAAQGADPACRQVIGPEQIERYNGYIAAKVFGGQARLQLGRGHRRGGAGGTRTCCRPAMPSSGPARPSRKSAPATRRSSPSPSRW
jgi:hypothetical protein